MSGNIIFDTQVIALLRSDLEKMKISYVMVVFTVF